MGNGVTTPILAVLSSAEKERKSRDFQKSGTRQINMFSVFWLVLWQPTMLRYLRKLVKVHAGMIFRPNYLVQCTTSVLEKIEKSLISQDARTDLAWE